MAIHEVSKREEVESYIHGFSRAQDAALEPGDATADHKTWPSNWSVRTNWSDHRRPVSSSMAEGPSESMNGGCVEIADNLPGVVAVRDSKRPEGGAHVIGRDAFAAFLADTQDSPVRSRGPLRANRPDNQPKSLTGCDRRP